MQQADFAPINFAPALVNLEEIPGGGFILRSPMPLEPYEESLGVLLRRWAGKSPDRAFLGERDSSGQWSVVTYREASRRANSIAQALIDRKLSQERPVMILSGNSVSHALLMLGCFIAGVPVVPVSVAYSLLSDDFRKLKAIYSSVKPAVVYAENAVMFSRALHALDLSGVEVVFGDGQVDGIAAIPFKSLTATPATREVDEAFTSVNSGTIAKLLFSSGSTGEPKGILNTHGMLCANQQMLAQLWPFTKETPPVLVDWLPWNHTFGGNHNFHLVLKSGGTLYIDEGKPVPGMVLKTVANLAEISPTIYFNVPSGFAMLLPYLERDEALRNSFFKDLQLIFYAGAALPQDLWQRLEAVAVLATGRKVPMTSSWGSTETSPLATSAHFPIDRAGVIGLPCPGVAIKMVPNGEKFELRVKGPNVTPGYLNSPDLTREAFDEDGFYKIGDAGMLADPSDPSKGITFAGRIAEDYKLTTGTWVHVGKTRLEVLTSAAPLLQDALVTGHDRDYVGILAWPNIQGCRDICGDTEGALSAEELVKREEVVEHIRVAMSKYNGTHMGSATRIKRIMLMTTPPSIDANEITDKGYINQRAALERRSQLVEQLYVAEPCPDVIIVS